MRKTVVIACVAAAIAAIHACKKKAPEETFNPTTLTVAVPAYVKNYVPEMAHPAGNQLTVEGVALGRKLFYEKMLSNDNSMSCATCHRQEHAFDVPEPFSRGTNGALGTRNAMAIVNLGWQQHMFWDGRRHTLEEQAHDPVTNPIEMANNWPEVVRRLQNHASYPGLFFKAFGTKTIDSNLVTKAIAQFERTLISFNSPFDRFYFQGDSSALTAQEKSGLTLFTGKAMCNFCHLMNAQFTDNHFANNGMDEHPADAGRMDATGLETDRGKFKVPTLRNIAQTAPYMHDSRFTTLEQVVEYYSSGIKQNSPNIDGHMADFGSGLHLSAQEKADLVAFLKTLTDHEFLTNPAFAKPN